MSSALSTKVFVGKETYSDLLCCMLPDIFLFLSQSVVLQNASFSKEGDFNTHTGNMDLCQKDARAFMSFNSFG